MLSMIDGLLKARAARRVLPLPLLLAVAAPALLGACGVPRVSSQWSHLRIDVDASVDGRPVHAHTLWRLRYIDGFPEGISSIPVSGYALALPVSPGRYVYGLFRMTFQGPNLGSWDLLATGLDNFLFEEDYLRHRPMVSQRSMAKAHDYATSALEGRRITICQKFGETNAGQDSCPVFVYFADPRDPQSVRMIAPQKFTDIGGHRVVIHRVQLSYQRTGEPAKDDSLLPPFLRGGQQPDLGSLPEGLSPADSRKLRVDDFRRP